jgi:hypothetical protein
MWPLLTALAMNPSNAADPNQPHAHQGVLPYVSAPSKPELSADDLAALGRGEAVLKPLKEADGAGRGVATQDIHATPDVIWAKIMTFSKYPDWVENVHECVPYVTNGDDVRVRFVVGAALISIEYFIQHEYHPEKGYLTWRLDYSRLSDLDDTVGYWIVEALPDRPGWSRVYYSVRVKMSGWIPGWVEDMLAKSGLTKATSWVKRESEAG